MIPSSSLNLQATVRYPYKLHLHDPLLSSLVQTCGSAGPVSEASLAEVLQTNWIRSHSDNFSCSYLALKALILQAGQGSSWFRPFTISQQNGKISVTKLGWGNPDRLTSSMFVGEAGDVSLISGILASESIETWGPVSWKTILYALRAMSQRAKSRDQ